MTTPRAGIRRGPGLALALLAFVSLLAGRAESQRLVVREEWSVTGGPGSELGAVSGMAESDDGSVWISDGVGAAVVRVPPDGGSPLRVTGRGDGPGEVQSPGFIARRPTGGLAVYDVARGSVDLFDSEGSFERRIQLERLVYNPKGFAVHPAGDVLLSGGLPGSDRAIHSFRSDGTLRASWYPAPKTRDPEAAEMIAGGPLFALADGGLLFSESAPHRLLHYPGPGRSPREIAHDPDLLEAVGDDFIRIEKRDGERHRVFDWWYPQSRGIFATPDGHVLNVVRYKADGRSVWEIYTFDGELVARGAVARAYQPWAVTRDGDILASYDDPETGEPTAARLSVTLND